MLVHPTRFRPLGRPLLVVVLALGAAGCTVGPDFAPPDAPPADAYTVHATTAGDAATRLVAQRFERAAPVRADWYRVFDSDKLDRLVAHAVDDSPSLHAARERLAAAREAVNATQGARLPRIDAGGGLSHRRASGIELGISDPAFINTFDLYQARVSASYDLDVFGKTRRRIEKSRARFDFQRFRALDAYVTLINNIVATALAEAGTNAAIETTQRIVDAQQDTLDIVQRQVELGAAIDADASQIRTRLARTRASLEPLHKQRALAVTRLATLTGRPPGTFDDPHFTLADFTLPKKLPVSVPSQLVRQRPDVRAARAMVHAASAQIGIATANLLPDFSITGAYSREALSLGALTDPVNALYQIGASASAPLFAGGRLRAQKRAARHEYEAALADYRATALAAFGDVARSLRSIESDARALRDQRTARAQARHNLETVRDQVDNGAADYIALYAAQMQYQQAALAAANARVTRFADSAALFHALGGGWWNADTDPMRPARRPAAGDRSSDPES